MQIAVIEVRYPYKMSYLDEWLAAWKRVSKDVQVFNILKQSESLRLAKDLSKFDLIIVLHSVTADSNKWLRDLNRILVKRNCPLILFVGNEYSNPWLSMESRLQNIVEISPEIIATQLTKKAGEFLYGTSPSIVVEIPHALPLKVPIRSSKITRHIDLGFRGYEYPWFLLDNDRNIIVEEVSDYFSSRNLLVDVSKTERLDKNNWYNFLLSCKATVASEGGSNFVFKTDAVWHEALEYLKTIEGKKYLNNDFLGAKVLRALPSGLKSTVRIFGKMIGKEQGSMSLLPPAVLEEVLTRINIEDYQFTSGKALTSRHLDAIFCGTWQILSPGDYNGVLRPGVHYSVWDPENPTLVLQEIEEAIDTDKSSRAYEELIQENSYQSRINKLLDRLYS